MNKKGYIAAPRGWRIFETLEEVKAWAHPNGAIASEVIIIEPTLTAVEKLEGFSL